MACVFATGLSSCSVVDKITRVNSFDVNYTELQRGTKTLRLVEMTNFGQPEFFENTRRLVYKSKAEGYILFYENVRFDSTSETDLRKVRKMSSNLMKGSSYKNRMKTIVLKGYTNHSSDSLLGLVNHLDFRDITGTELVQVYEENYGPIALTKKDLSTPLEEFVKPSLPRKRVESIIVTYRNKHLAQRIDKSPYHKIIVLYNAENKAGLIKELKDNPEPFRIEGKGSTKDDTAYLQPVPVDSLRKINSDHIRQDGFIDDMGGYLVLSTALRNYNELFSLHEGSEKSYFYYPNLFSAVRFSVNYKSVSVSYSLGLNKAYNLNLKGKTTSHNLRFNILKNNWIQDINLEYINGFYLSNTKDFVPQWKEGDAYLQKNNLTYLCLEGSTGYKFNSKFSLRSIKTQTERQLRSAGSWIAVTNYRYFALLDEEEGSVIGEDSIKFTNNQELGLNIGYYYTLVIHKNFYVSAGASPGYGIIHTRAQENKQNGKTNEEYYSGVVRFKANIGMGYNGERFFTGLYGDYSLGALNNTDAPIINTDSNALIQLFVGYRMEAPRFLRSLKML